MVKLVYYELANIYICPKCKTAVKGVYHFKAFGYYGTQWKSFLMCYKCANYLANKYNFIKGGFQPFDSEYSEEDLQ